uniref:Metallo-beta-lactamase domain-containing protein n=1 Tax=Attheya septentrionalis TaxID=420275 RepID=A0A7S2UIR3_9STRA|mmetsp:Transcript_27490/g.49901  ORF Transcript_27490/g.49901 Transcript_27490/m.49901 type:complete len:474 (+) Transcript_27490:97-1518(+)
MCIILFNGQSHFSARATTTLILIASLTVQMTCMTTLSEYSSEMGGVHAFVPKAAVVSSRQRRIRVGYSVVGSSLGAITRQKPQRLEENVEGVLYVNDRCINCAACAQFAPTVFDRSPANTNAPFHRVYHQPSSESDVEQARAALSACPVAAIRVENSAALSHAGHSKLSPADEALAKQLAIRQPPTNNRLLKQPSSSSPLPLFPRPVLDHLQHVYFLGHHNEASFGATPYLVRGSGTNNNDSNHHPEVLWVMVDVPKFSASSVKAVTSLTGPNGPSFLFLTHVDDTADHQKWKDAFPSLQRIFHSGDLGPYNWLHDETLEDVEVLLCNNNNNNNSINNKDSVPSNNHKPMMAWNLQGDVLCLPEDVEKEEFVIWATPGHSPGSIALLYRPEKVLFTGDTYAYSTRDGGGMSGFPRYGNDLPLQSRTLNTMLQHADQWDIIAPGHGHIRDYSSTPEKQTMKESEMKHAIQTLVK